jgi:hypothetical protein
MAPENQVMLGRGWKQCFRTRWPDPRFNLLLVTAREGYFAGQTQALTFSSVQARVL